MPPVATLEALRRAVAAFPAWELDLLIEPTALAAAQQSLSISGLLLVGEVHGSGKIPLSSTRSWPLSGWTAREALAPHIIHRGPGERQSP
jgi:hypothetical protein